MVNILCAVPKQKKEPTVPVRLPASVARRVARVAAHRGESSPDYLGERLASVLDQDEAAMLEDLKRERGEKVRR